MTDKTENFETLERRSDGDKAVSQATREEAQAGSEQQTQDVKDYYEARRNGLRDKHTSEIFGKQPAFYDSSAQESADYKTADAALNQRIAGQDKSEDKIKRNNNQDVSEVKYPDGSKTSVKYDDSGNPKEVKLAEDRTWKKTGDHWERYDAKGRSVETFDGDISVSKEGDVTAITKDGKSAHIKHPDGAETDIDGESQTTVDKDGKLRSVTRPNGHTAKMDYDQNGSLKEIQLPDKSFKKEDGVWNEYDQQGKKVGKFDGDFATTKDGDVAVINKDNSTDVYHRDGSNTNIGADKSQVVTGPNGEVTSVTYPNGATNKIQYDADGFPKQIDSSNGSTLVKDGDHWTEYKNGKKVGQVDAEFEVRDDGSIVSADSKGKRTTTHRDGSVDRS